MPFSRNIDFVKALLPIFRVYQLNGFSPFSVPPFPRSFLTESRAQVQIENHRWSRYAKFLCCVLFISVISSLFTDSTYVEDTTSRMLNYMSFLMVLSSRSLSMVIVIESLVGAREQMSFLGSLESIDRMLQQKLGQIVEQVKTRSNTTIWLIIWVVKIAALQIFVVLTSKILQEKGMKKFWWLLFMFPTISSSIRYFQLIHYIELVGLRFSAFNEHLINLCDKAEGANTNSIISIQFNKFDDKRDRKLIDQIILSRIIYNRLWEACGALNHSFRWTLLLSVGSSFVIIVVNLYRSFVFLLTTKSQNTVDDIIMFFVWAMFHILYLMMISKAAAEAIDEVQSKVSHQT